MTYKNIICYRREPKETVSLRELSYADGKSLTDLFYQVALSDNDADKFRRLVNLMPDYYILVEFVAAYYIRFSLNDGKNSTIYIKIKRNI